MAFFLIALATILVPWGIQILYRLRQNIIAARKIGLPVVIVPVDQHQLLWLLLSPRLRPFFQRILPSQIWKPLALAIRGWEFHEKLRPFDQTHPNKEDRQRSFVMAGLRCLEFWTADPKAAEEILNRVRDFQVPHALEFALGQYGPNVLTSNGEQWNKHRRIITSLMDERLFRAVFEESQQQTLDLLYELQHTERLDGSGRMSNSVKTERLFDQMKTITIHVLLGSVMGVQVPWGHNDIAASESPFRMTHETALAIVVTNLAGIGLLPTSLLTKWPSWLPGHRMMNSVGHAKVEVYARSKQQLDQQRKKRTSTRNLGDGSSARDVTSKLVQRERAGGSFLSEDEMISNQFILTAAGFETTATTLVYALVLLSRYPDWQDWLLEEVDMLWSDEQAKEMKTMYSTVFPRAKRITAFMMETVRLYSPVPHMHRECGSAQSIQTSTGTIRLPAHTRVYVNAIALHLLPIWRDINRQADPAFVDSRLESADEYSFRPSRWINTEGAEHVIYHPPKGTFVPWAMGPRVCPGQKMAQVEFVAVISTLLRRHRIEAVPKDTEEWADVEQRLDARLRDSQWVTVLQMNDVFDPEKGKGLNMRLISRK